MKRIYTYLWIILMMIGYQASAQTTSSKKVFRLNLLEVLPLLTLHLLIKETTFGRLHNCTMVCSILVRICTFTLN